MKTTVDVLICCLAYGGNGGVATLIPEIAFWLVKLRGVLASDPRIGRVELKKYGDVPLTMERNRMVRDAINGGYDIVLMLDSDNAPDLYLGKRHWAKPFWETSFEFAFERLLRGVPTVVAAPYCGPNPHPAHGGQSNVYVFYAESFSTNPQNPGFHVESYSRDHAAQLRGIQEIFAGPTGVILYTTSAFELMVFDKRPTVQILADYKSGILTAEQCERAIKSQSYFFYEFTDGWQTAKASTEDVTNTREIGMAGQYKHGEPIVFCNWDAWAGHNKPEMIGMPEPIRMEQVSRVYQEAVFSGLKVDECIAEVDFLGERKGTPEEYEKSASKVFADESDDLDQETLDRRDMDQVDDDEPAASPVNPEIKPRMICGRKAYSVGHITPDKDLEALTAMAKNVGTITLQREGTARPLRMLEVGSWVGESALALIGGAPRDSRIYCVDHWQGSSSDWTCHIAKEVDVWDWFLKNTDGLVGVTIFPIKGDSVQAAADLGDSQDLDLIFLDADHEEASLRADIDAWLRHLSPNGVLCGHDYSFSFPGVVNALEAFLGPLKLVPSRIHGTSIWFVTNKQIMGSRAALVMANATVVGQIPPNPKRPASDPASAANQA